jgi:hypothetical protein
MDTLFFHPKVVHVPMALGVLMPLITGGLALAWWRNWLPWRAWFVAVGLQIVLVTSGLVALRTGEIEEERVERVVSERVIETHEESAEVFVGASGAVLGVMVAAAVFGRRRSGLPIAAAATLGTLVVLGLGYSTGQTGGTLVYEHGATRAYGSTTSGTGGPGTTPAARKDDDD